MMFSVSTTPQKLPVGTNQRITLQNFSAGGQRIFWSHSQDDLFGCVLEPGPNGQAGIGYDYYNKMFETGGGEIWVYASSDGAELRYLVAG